MDEGFAPRDYFERSIKFWWILFVCMLIGAGAGWLVTQYKTPTYEAKSSISVSINYAETGFLTDTEEDHALSVVGDVLISDAILDDLRTSLDTVSLDGISRSNLFVEREGYRWTLRVRAESPQLAKQISKNWAEVSMLYLNESLDHARKGLILSRQIAELETCLSQSLSVLPSAVPCTLPGSVKTTDLLQVLGERYSEEQSLSNGILPSLVFSLSQAGTQAGTPAATQSAGMVFAGAMLGFFAGIIMIFSGVPHAFFKVPVRGK